MAAKTFGETVRELRKAAGYESQEALARRLGVSLFTVSRWERDENRPDFDGLYRLADALGVTVAELLPTTNGAAA
jgi:transcriptional regulator with XRE-family HTH domain